MGSPRDPRRTGSRVDHVTAAEPEEGYWSHDPRLTPVEQEVGAVHMTPAEQEVGPDHMTVVEPEVGYWSRDWRRTGSGGGSRESRRT